MSTKTREERANLAEVNQYLTCNHSSAEHDSVFECQKCGTFMHGFLAGQQDFIENELPKYLEMARETFLYPMMDRTVPAYRYTTSYIIDLARRGE